MENTPVIVWFRQDLRLEDNPAFQAALDRKTSIIPLYIYSPQEEGEWKAGGASRWWLHHSLESLSQELSDVGLNLVIRTGNPLENLLEIIASTKAAAVFWNRCYEPYAIKRDIYLKEALHESKILTKSFNANLLFEPWTIANKQNKPFQVFTPFWKTCLSVDEPPQPLPFPQVKHLKSFKVDSLPLSQLHLLPHIHWDTGIQAVWKPGAKQAKKVLDNFLKNSIEAYKDQRDRPDLPGVSYLSPYLHFGEISPRMIWQAVKMQCDPNEEGVECFLRQLGWREFAYHLLYHFPKTPLEPLRKEFLKFPWVNHEDHLKLWQMGKTGYPIVDAGMRQLWTTGWMHNRLRMIVGSFLVKDLLIPWQMGAVWFWDTLVDADLANNTLGWQWIGGCGADAAPYFRVFNPVTQGEKFDPEGNFVRKWVPEIASLPNRWIHKPWEASEIELRSYGFTLGHTYPKPLVDHDKARLKALEAFNQLKN